jgi:hypothetical protein
VTAKLIFSEFFFFSANSAPKKKAVCARTLPCHCVLGKKKRAKKKPMAIDLFRVRCLFAVAAVFVSATVVAVATPEGMRLQIQARSKPVYACSAPFVDTLQVEMRPENMTNALPFIQAGFTCNNSFGDFMWFNATRLTVFLSLSLSLSLSLCFRVCITF